MRERLTWNLAVCKRRTCTGIVHEGTETTVQFGGSLVDVARGGLTESPLQSSWRQAVVLSANGRVFFIILHQGF